MTSVPVWGSDTSPVMSSQTYQALCSLIYHHSRIHLVPSKLSLLTSRLGKRLRELNLSSWEDYLDWLSRRDSQEIENLIDLVSTNHTHFFREAVHFELLTTKLLDGLLQCNPTARDGLRCWSAACSSGEEVFTLAIVLSEFAARRPGGLSWRVEGTDISSRAIYKAREAVYPLDRLGLPEPALLHKYFQKGSGKFHGFCRVKDEVRRKVYFQRMNLFDRSYRIPVPQHVVFCRNVLIYFDLASQAQLVQRLHDVLEPGGYLIVGHSDSLLRIQHPLKALGNGIYQRER
ncbi:MAG: CheR family methyltransferase [Limnohabitans sp.]